jgi:hypothetical protein
LRSGAFAFLHNPTFVDVTITGAINNVTVSV